MNLTTRVFISGAFLSALLSAQTSQSSNPENNAPVFLDNHRPLNQKKDKAPTSRTVTGVVVDDSGQPIEGALVTLVDTKTKEKFEFFTKKDGRYKFEDLSFSVDYQLQAKWKNMMSEERKLSQYDHTARIIRQLEVTTPEGAPPPATGKPTTATASDKPKS